MVFVGFRTVGRGREAEDDLLLSIYLDRADHLHCSVQVPGDPDVTPESTLLARGG